MDHGDYFACYEPTPRIEEWAIVGDANPYQAPELRELRITGLVYGHPRFNDGAGSHHFARSCLCWSYGRNTQHNIQPWQDVGGIQEVVFFNGD